MSAAKKEIPTIQLTGKSYSLNVLDFHETKDPAHLYASLTHPAYHEDLDKDDLACKNRLTRGGVNEFLKTEKERMFGRGSNIQYFLHSGREARLQITRKQFDELIKQAERQTDDGTLSPGYDDNGDGISIHVTMFHDRSRKTLITIDI